MLLRDLGKTWQEFGDLPHDEQVFWRHQAIEQAERVGNDVDGV